MNILNKTFYHSDYKHRGKIKKWGKVIHLQDDDATIFLSSNPPGSKTFHVKLYEINVWISKQYIFLKEKVQSIT